MVKEVQLQQLIEKEKRKLKLGEIRDNPEYNDGIREDIRTRITKLNDELKTRQESISLLKGRLTNQITSFKETIAEVFDKDVSLADKIQTLFWEQIITIASILTAIGMAISLLVEALLPDRGGGSVCGTRGGTARKPLPNYEKGLKGWLRNKLPGVPKKRQTFDLM